MVVAESSRRPDRLVISAPLPPSSNHIYANNARGGRVLTKEAREYKHEVEQVMMTQRAKKRCPEPPFVLSLHLRLPDARRADASNRCKVLEDAIFEQLGYDDSLVYDVHLFKYVAPNDPGVTVEIRHTDRRLEAAV